MRVRPIYIASAVLLFVAGSLFGWFAFSIPKDLRAEALLKEARTDLQAKNEDDAQQKLLRVIRDYPRTDSAAAATAALFELQQRKNAPDPEAEALNELLQKRILALRSEQQQQATRIAELEKRLAAAEKKAAAAPAVAARKTTPKKAPAKKTTTRRKR
jgi:TolA-binding protein